MKRGVLLAADGLNVCKKNIWLVSADAINGAILSVVNAKKERQLWHLEPGENGILACDSLSIEVTRGSIDYKQLDFPLLCKLQAFIDEAQQYNSIPAQGPHWIYQPLEKETMQHCLESKIDHWFLNYSLQQKKDQCQIVSFLRRSENYSLIRFLLNESSNNVPLKTISAKYGLSASHFRRLTRHALGKNAKCELRHWRVIRALLASIRTDKKTRLTDTAIEYGYASLSHFSSEVKQLFGFSPRELKNSIMNDITHEIY